MKNKSGLTRVTKTVRGKKGTAKRTYWVKGDDKKPTKRSLKSEGAKPSYAKRAAKVGAVLGGIVGAGFGAVGGGAGGAAVIHSTVNKTIRQQTDLSGRTAYGHSFSGSSVGVHGGGPHANDYANLWKNNPRMLAEGYGRGVTRGAGAGGVVGGLTGAGVGAAIGYGVGKVADRIARGRGSNSSRSALHADGPVQPSGPWRPWSERPRATPPGKNSSDSNKNSQEFLIRDSAERNRRR